MNSFEFLKVFLMVIHILMHVLLYWLLQEFSFQCITIKEAKRKSDLNIC